MENMASTMYNDYLSLVMFSFIYLDVRNMKTVVCKFVSPLDTQALPVYCNDR